ncbi:MAG: hypothetical protein HYX84_02610 [Chloroflexi bacterium]|nr:hypothetical protein [Chloroflexota bacterium]
MFTVILLLFSFACEPLTVVTFQNQRNEDVKLFVATVLADGSIDAFVDFGTIPAQTTKTISITFLGDEMVNRLQIRDSAGKVLLSNDYTRPDLKKIGWKITIPP